MRNLVIGIDGSPGARRALEWAVGTVGLRGSVHAVAAVTPETELPSEPILAGRADYRNRLAQRLEGEWLAPARGRVASLTSSIAEDHAGVALRRAVDEHGADAIVVGAHEPTGVMPRTIGSTVRRLLIDLSCPLIVVPDSPTEGLGGNLPLIVGVGHGEGTQAAIRWAADLAGDRSLPIGLVRATGEAPVFSLEGLLQVLAFYIDPAKRAEWTQEDLDAFADEIEVMSDGAVDVETSVRSGVPAHQLVDASRKAGLLIIGQHRSVVDDEPRATRALRYALTHARCPVAVIPIDTR